MSEPPPRQKSAPPSTESPKRVRVLVVDDHPFFREGIIGWINQQPDLVACGEAGTIAEARQAVETLKPDVVLLDLRLGDGDGLDLLPELCSRHPGIHVIAVSQSDEDTYAHRALRAGARGYIMKSEATDVLLTAIQTVQRGEIHLSRRATARLTHNLFPDPAGTSSNLAHLSDRELQVFQLLGAGHGPSEIARILKISPKTVETYREHLKVRLRLKDGAALLRAAILWVETGNLDKSPK